MNFLPTVDARPTSQMEDVRPAALHPSLWAASRPTSATLDNLLLPAGTTVHGKAGQLLAWESAPASPTEIGALWLRCAKSFPATGLWPVCDYPWPIEPERRWQHTRGNDGSLVWRDPYALPVDVYGAAELPDRDGQFDDRGEPESYRRLMEDFGITETEMIPAAAAALPDDPLARLVAPVGHERLTLVACRRPADASLVLDFGVANDDATPGIFAGVVRSWEERFGVVPVMLDPSWTAFQAVAPPTEDVQVERLSAEIFAFATDTALQGGFHIQNMAHEASAKDMARSREWLIWWD
ncbi:hypothetical protein ABIE44_000543 [Marmoricola sp. OAE513]|uniref:DUF4253 domain-containing protein n=1 Tax=Marmoricola sp. OAE513 TaxID=2817894 RepID=UPI001AE86E91